MASDVIPAWDRSAIVELADTRGALSLAAQVVYHVRVLELLREDTSRAAALLNDPVFLASEYAKRWGAEAELGDTPY